MSNLRLTMYNSDLFRNVYEFSALGFSDYNYREPLYWAFGKIVTEISGDPWIAVTTLDVTAAISIFLSLRSRKLSLIAVAALALSPLFVLGICNIHRQFIAFAVWLLVVRRGSDDKIDVKSFYHGIPFLIHNSLGILSIVYFLAVLVSERRWSLLIALGIVGIALLVGFGNAISGFFREGTDTTTSLGLYLMWSVLVGVVAVLMFPEWRFLRWFAVLGTIFSIVLFVGSGGSSGSRFFMLVVTAMAFWLFDRQKFEKADFRTTALLSSLGVLLVVPTLTNAFSRDIVVAAYYDLPFGMAL